MEDEKVEATDLELGDVFIEDCDGELLDMYIIVDVEETNEMVYFYVFRDQKVDNCSFEKWNEFSAMDDTSNLIRVANWSEFRVKEW